jgi:protein phosphatase
MGGHRAGEVASRLAIEAVEEFVRRSAADGNLAWPYGVDPDLSLDGNRLKTAIRLANDRIVQEAEGRDDYAGMGTTICALLVNRSGIVIGSVGDSRVYVLSDGVLRQLTTDDSWIAALQAQDPTVDPAQLAHHPLRNVLTSALGGRDTIDVRIVEQPLVSGDVLLLCSDGLYGALLTDRLTEILLATPDVEAAARALVDAAVRGGSRDNVTAVVVRYEADVPDELLAAAVQQG